MKTSELIGKALDYAVGVSEGYRVEYWHKKAVAICFPNAPRAVPWRPSIDWSQGGPIIEREGIEITRCNDLYFPKGNEKGDYYEQYWQAVIDLRNGDVMVEKQYGPTPLIAAMRCLVASKLRACVEIPEELNE